MAVQPEAAADLHNVIETNAAEPLSTQPLERFAFHDRAGTAFAVVQTGETRLYGKMILKKGVIG